MALRYHGHQFRVYNPEIGDGRGFLFAQLRDDRDRLLDLGTKGSGQTPYSRTGDGRLTLKGGVREVLATEMLEALGVNTSKTFALFETGEAAGARRRALADPLVGADPAQPRPYPHRHLPAPRLLRGCRRHRQARRATASSICLTSRSATMPKTQSGCSTASAGATATLAASYIAAGFVHGVLNSDNINVTGESFDYGPWRFAPEWDEGFTAAYFDETGLYAFGRQPEAIHWDVAQLGGCLALIGEAPPLSDMLAPLAGAVRGGAGRAAAGAAWRRSAAAMTRIARWCRRCSSALRSRAGRDRPLLLRLARRADPGRRSLSGARVRRASRAGWRARQRPLTHPYWSDLQPCSMLIDEVEAIWAAIAERDDWGPFEAKIAAIRRMG